MTVLARLRDLVTSHLVRAPVLWMVLLLVSATIIGTAVSSYREIDKQLTTVALLRRETVAQIAAVTLAEKFGRVVDVAISLSTRVRFRDLVARGKWVEAIQIMRDVPRDLPHIERLFLTDTKGTLMSDVPELPGVRGMNFAFREWYQGVSRDWHPYVSPVYTRTAAPRRRIFTVAVPVKSAAGRIVGVLALQIRVENLLGWINAINTGREGFIYIVDPKGQLAFHSRHPNSGEIVDLSATPVVQKLRRGEHGVETGLDPVENEESVMAYAVVPGYGWGVVAQQPTRASIAFATKQDQLRRLLSGYGLILLLSAMAIYLTSRLAIQRRQAEDDRRLNTELERLVAERTVELTRTNELLSASETRFRAVADTANDAVISADSRGLVVYFNKAAERIFGYSAADMLHQPLTRLMPPRFRAAHEQGLKRFVAGGEGRITGRTVELAGTRKNGEEFPLELSLSTWKIGEETFFTGLMRDITQRRRNEEQIQQLNRDLEQRAVALSAINRELEAFSYSVSHDLRAPLRAIDGFSQILLEDHADNLSAEGRDSLQRVRTAAHRMGSLIDDLLNLSRVTRAELKPEQVDLSAIARDIAQELRGQDPERDTEFTVSTDVRVHGDSRLLRIALQNLLDNAWKFTRGRAGARIVFGVSRHEGEPTYFVRDSGVGFDMNYAGKLFGAFQRLHDAREFPGTGIGLATVQRVIHRHGGRIWAESAVGQGTTFYFTLS